MRSHIVRWTSRLLMIVAQGLLTGTLSFCSRNNKNSSYYNSASSCTSSHHIDVILRLWEYSASVRWPSERWRRAWVEKNDYLPRRGIRDPVYIPISLLCAWRGRSPLLLALLCSHNHHLKVLNEIIRIVIGYVRVQPPKCGNIYLTRSWTICWWRLELYGYAFTGNTIAIVGAIEAYAYLMATKLS